MAGRESFVIGGIHLPSFPKPNDIGWQPQVRQSGTPAPVNEMPSLIFERSLPDVLWLGNCQKIQPGDLRFSRPNKSRFFYGVAGFGILNVHEPPNTIVLPFG